MLLSSFLKMFQEESLNPNDAIIYEIVTRHLNRSIKKYDYPWRECPEQNPETRTERMLSKFAEDYEFCHFRELIEMADWFMVDRNMLYPDVRDKVLAVLFDKRKLDLKIVISILAWGGLQAVRSIPRTKNGETAMIIRDFVVIMLEEIGLVHWVHENGGWVIHSI